MTIASILWRRLDVGGHEACRLTELADGWRLEGTAVFRCASGPSLLAYEVSCDRAWRSRRGRVRGWVGGEAVDLSIARATDGAWTLDDAVAPGLADCPDLDLGFTPATNLIAIRRLGLEVGAAADAPAAWLDVEARRLGRLDQRYDRRSESTFWYEAPSVGYAGLLEISADGFVTRYPGLWEAEP